MAWATTVVSDTVQFAGPVTPGSTPTTFKFHSTACSLNSDADPASSYSCTITGGLTKTTTGYNGGMKVKSGDGTMGGRFTLTHTSAGGYVMKGKVVEVGTEGGTTTKYSATVSGQASVTAPGSISGTFTVSEQSTSP